MLRQGKHGRPTRSFAHRLLTDHRHENACPAAQGPEEGDVEILAGESGSGAGIGGEPSDATGARDASHGEASVKLTTKYMTKYERARIIGTRALQLRCVFVLARVSCETPLHHFPPRATLYSSA